MKFDPTVVFSNKAENYARFRWDYSPQAIETIFDITQLTGRSAVADIGAGTGILTRHFAGRVGRLYAIEPNPDMRSVVTRKLDSLPSLQVIDGSAEATTLPDDSVDLITVAQAIHWFEPGATKTEMGRILKSGGWLAIMRNISTDDERDAALGKIIADILKTNSDAGSSVVYPSSRKKPVALYFVDGDYQELTFEFQLRQNWPQFIGVLSTVSYIPAEDDPLFVKITNEARHFFDRHSQDGTLIVHGETELLIGRPNW